MIEREPHLVFSGLWLARYLAMIAGAAFDLHWLFVGAAFAFFPLEGAGVVLQSAGLRDTLSELWTWVLRKLSKHERPFQGWNWLAVIFATFESSTLYYLLSPLLPDLFVGVMSAGLAAMLHAHWLRPDIHG